MQLFARDALEEAVRQRGQDPGAVAGVDLGAARSAMIDVAEHGRGVDQDLVAALALDVRDEADAAGVVLEGGVVEPDLAGPLLSCRSLVAFVLHRTSPYTATETEAEAATGSRCASGSACSTRKSWKLCAAGAETSAPRRDDPERAVELGLELDHHQRAVLGLAPHRAARQDRELVGVLEQALERVDVVDLLRDVGLGAVLAQVALDVARHRELRVEAHHRQAVEIGGGHLAAHREAMVRRADHAHALVAQRPHLDAAPAPRVRDDAEVAGARAHRAIDLFRALVVDADLDAGVASLRSSP